jgi:phosphatidylglycerol:prolipoprotein diacylglycerol transferase
MEPFAGAIRESSGLNLQPGGTTYRLVTPSYAKNLALSMFPYFDIKQWHVGSVLIHPFIILVAAGYTLGYLITAHRMARKGTPREQISQLGLWMMAAGFLCSYLMALAYVPAVVVDVLHHPRKAFTFTWGLSSFGGFAGGLIGAAAFFRYRRIGRTERLMLLDAVGFGIPFGWALARVGCYLVHDHPGIRTMSWLGVRYPGGTRYDLGLLEVLFLLALGGVFLLLDQKPRPPGFYQVVLFLPYGIFRLFEDRLRIDPPRYFGWTVDQVASAVMIAYTLIIVMQRFRCNISSCFRYVTSAVGSIGTGTR